MAQCRRVDAGIIADDPIRRCPWLSAVSGVTPGSPLTTRDTVFSATPARDATSFIVGRPAIHPNAATSGTDFLGQASNAEEADRAGRVHHIAQNHHGVRLQPFDNPEELEASTSILHGAKLPPPPQGPAVSEMHVSEQHRSDIREP